jgi:hypothetical protein
VGTTWVASKPGGLNVRNDDAREMGTCMKSFEAELLLVADPLAELGEGRSREGRNGHVHLSDHRGTGPSIQGKIRRDNVGKGHLPAGAGSNLQRPAKRGTTKGGGRELV